MTHYYAVCRLGGELQEPAKKCPFTNLKITIKRGYAAHAIVFLEKGLPVSTMRLGGKAGHTSIMSLAGIFCF